MPTWGAESVSEASPRLRTAIVRISVTFSAPTGKASEGAGRYGYGGSVAEMPMMGIASAGMAGSFVVTRSVSRNVPSTVRRKRRPSEAAARGGTTNG